MATIFKNGNIITGTGQVIEKGTIAIDERIITFVGPAKGLVPSKKDTVFDLVGKTVLPGLIDCHVHLCLDESADVLASIARDSIPTNTLKAALHARRTLEAGITTIRDLGGKGYVDIAVRDGIETGLLEGPRMLCSGKPICMTGGQGWQYGREADGADGVRVAVREQVKAGADVIKLMATGGPVGGTDPAAGQLTLEELRAGIEEAHKAGRRTATHAHGGEGLKNALLAGIDSVEHGALLDDEAIQMILEKKAYLVPTLSIPHHILQEGVKRGIPAYIVDRTIGVMKSHLEGIKKAHKAGIPIAMGTDAGTSFNRHGGNLWELELLVRKTGFSPMEAIMAATKTASEVLGLEKRIGTIEKGKLADLIVVKGNPLKDIVLLQDKDKLLAIMKEGHFHKCVL